ncbi:hypothetical protein OIE50_24845 [Streptomyces canus]|uniref:hypothetical protein n=1 Tax=Streptomyces canus TaxID=58343 RepID=UPI003254D04C
MLTVAAHTCALIRGGPVTSAGVSRDTLTALPLRASSVTDELPDTWTTCAPMVSVPSPSVPCSQMSVIAR